MKNVLAINFKKRRVIRDKKISTNIELRNINARIDEINDRLSKYQEEEFTEELESELADLIIRLEDSLFLKAGEA